MWVKVMGRVGAVVFLTGLSTIRIGLKGAKGRPFGGNIK